jgi:hypothetical protein
MMLVVTRRGYYLNSQMEKRALLAQPPEVTTSIQEIKLSARPLISEIRKLSRRVKQAVHQVPHQEVRLFLAQEQVLCPRYHMPSLPESEKNDW